MKKTVLIAVGLGLSAAAWAQKSNIRAAVNALNDKEYEKAKTAIEAAVNDESTKNDPKAWFTRGIVYLAIQQQPVNEGKDIYSEAGRSFLKALSLDAGYEKEDMNNKLFGVAIYYFNDGLIAFDKKEYDKSYTHFGEVVNINSLEGNKRFSGNKKFDTIAHQAALYQGYSAYYANKFDQAAPLLIAAKADPIVKDSNVYLMLSDIYEAKNDRAGLEALIKEARAAYPNSKAIANRELNVALKYGNTDETISKLQEAISKEPNNAELLFNLAVTYDNLANPKDKSGKDMPKPANYDELFTKSEKAYADVLKAAPDKADFNFNAGALYFNRAVHVNEQMNAITGSSAADIKKYDGLKAERDQWFDKALPYLEKTYNTLEPNFAKLGPDDKNTYIAAVVAAKEIYAKQNKLDKATEMKKKIEAIKQ